MPNQTHKTLATQDDIDQCTYQWWLWLAIVVSYAAVTVFDLIRGIIHTFLYENGLKDISGLATEDPLCNSRLSVLMIGYGGANLESFLVRAYILYIYAGYNSGLDIVRVSCLAPPLWSLVTSIGVSMGTIDIGDASVPGKTMMHIRTVVSMVTFVLTLLADCQ